MTLESKTSQTYLWSEDTVKIKQKDEEQDSRGTKDVGALLNEELKRKLILEGLVGRIGALIETKLHARLIGPCASYGLSQIFHQ